eukprot:gene472-6883_t
MVNRIAQSIFSTLLTPQGKMKILLSLWLLLYFSCEILSAVSFSRVTLGGDHLHDSSSDSSGVITLQGGKNGLTTLKHLGVTPDPVIFYNTPLGGDGSMTVLVGKNSGSVSNTFSNTANGDITLGGIMVRENNNGDSRMVTFGFKNQIGYLNNNQYSKIYYRTTSGLDPTSEQVLNPLFDGGYHGYVKITRTGTTFEISTSDDKITWLVAKTVTFGALPSTFRWGVFLDCSSQYVLLNALVNTEEVTFRGIEFTGFSLCSSSQYYSYTTQSCVSIPSFLECGQNNWRYRFLSDSTSNDNLQGTYPIFSKSSSTLTLASSFLGAYSDTSHDNVVYSFKKVGGVGTISAKVFGIESPGGVMVKHNLKNERGKQAVMAACIVPPAGSPIVFKYRTTANTNAQSQIENSFIVASGAEYWVYLEITNTKASCYASDDGSTFNRIGSTSWTPIASYSAGVMHYGYGQTSKSIKFSNINLIGFTGFCDNHGDCKTVGDILDHCVCKGGYFGEQCSLFTCGSPSCNERGTCIAPNSCICETGYGGNVCQYPNCYGILSNETASCNTGTCTSPDSCNCPLTYAGEKCQYPRCFGIASNVGTVCSGHGTCSSPDTCVCDSGWAGSDCDTKSCNGLIDPIACSGANGTCDTPNVCNCTTGHIGTSCEFNLCYGKSSNEVNVCSGHGNCQNPDSCVCNNGYTGTECEKPICFGLVDPIACSVQNGTCQNPNDCACTIGHIGAQCEHNICFGKISNDSSVCSGHGSCQNPDSCACFSGYTGIQCEIPICYGEIEPIACSQGNGTCSSPNNCVCKPGYAGSSCNLFVCNHILSNETSTCNGQGYCIGPDSCLCKSTYTGPFCQYPICYGYSSIETTNVCSGNGTCASPNNCICKNGYYGDNCNIYSCNGVLSNETNTCSSHGNCIGLDSCICDAGYTGPYCEFNVCDGISSNDSLVCTGYGLCVAPDTCICISGWKRTFCDEFTCEDRNSCSTHGSCEGPNNCSCISTYGGQNCSDPYCYGTLSTDSNVCSTKGNCISPNNCECISDGYTGDICNITICTSVNDCSDNGVCVGANNCSCFSGWKNSNCSSFHCDDVNNCTNPNGLCIGPNICNCTSQWSGNDCKSPVCFSVSSLNSNACSGNGNCTSPDVCSCKENWVGNNCHIAVCNNLNATNPTVCNSRGNCVSPNNCSCNIGYTGNDCQYNLCYGISSELNNVCSSHGSCNSPNNCTCSPEWSGKECHYPVCYGFSSVDIFACTNQTRGICSSPNNCTCNTGYTGLKCEHNICFGIASNSTNVCTSHGNCTKPDICTCDAGFYGDKCKNSHLFDFVQEKCDQADKCKLNMTIWEECIKTIGVKCYCDSNSPLNTADTQIECDSTSAITSIKIENSGLKNNLQSMKNFGELKNLNLRSNLVGSGATFSTIFASKIESLNLGFNDLTNIALFYQFYPTVLQSFKSINLDGNGLCGIIPSSWIDNPTFNVSLENHNQTFWCSSFKSTNVCKKIQLLDKKYVMFPHETNITLRYEPQNVDAFCLDFLVHSNLKCNVRKFDNVNSSEFDHISTGKNEFITCPRDLYSEINQYINFAWKYSSGKVEVISTDIHLLNLPFSNILGTDRHLIYSTNSGTMQDIYLFTDQNMTLYRKKDTDSIQCFVAKDAVDVYNVPAISTTKTGKILKCSINLTQPDDGEKRIYLADLSRNKVVNSFVSIWLVNPQVINPEFYSSYVGKIYLRDSLGNKLPGKQGFPYALTNDEHSYSFPCAFSSDLIQYCTKEIAVTFENDISIIPLNFTDGNYTISSINTLFYKKNKVLLVFPKASLVNHPVDILVIFNTSTFNTSVSGINYQCESEFKNFSAFVVNETTIRCLSVQYDKTATLIFNIVLIKDGFKAVMNEETFNYYVIKANSIYPSISTVSFQQNRIFSFSFVESIGQELFDQLECQLNDGSKFKAVWKSNQDFECNITSTNHHNLTFWFIDIHGDKIKLSSNEIQLYLFKTGSISYSNNSSQFGLTGGKYVSTVKLDSSNIPSKFFDDIICLVDNIKVETVNIGNNQFNCSVTSEVAGYRKISVDYQTKNAFKVPGVHNTFENRLMLSYDLNVTQGLNLGYFLNTQILIKNGEIKNDCSDIIATFNNSRIFTKITDCNTTNTKIQFAVQKSEIHSPTTSYALYYGNKIIESISGTIASTTYSTAPTATLSTISTVKLNNADIEFGFLKQFDIQSIDPLAALITNSTVNITTNYSPIDYSGRVKFQMSYEGNKFDAEFDGKTFNSIVFANKKQTIHLSIWVIYLPTQQLFSASNNSISFIFMELIPALYLYPFADKYTITSNSKTSAIQVYLASNISTETGLNCATKINGTTKYSMGKTNGTMSLIECSLLVDDLSSITEFVLIDLYMNVSSNPEKNFIVTRNALTYVFFKEPILLNIPATIDKNYFNQEFSINFDDPLKNESNKMSYSSYNFRVIPEFQNPETNLLCTYNSSKPVCRIQNLTSTYSPNKLNYKMYVFSPHFSDNVTIDMSSNYFKQNISFLSELPFVADAIKHIDTTLTVNFKVNKYLHESFTFFCRIYGTDTVITKQGALGDTFTCSFNSRGFEEVVIISIVIKGSGVIGLDGLISESDSKIHMVSLKFVPEYSELNESTSLLITKNNSNIFAIPSNYQSFIYGIQSVDNQYSFDCSIQQNQLNCSKGKINESPTDIFSLPFQITYRISEGGALQTLVGVRQGLLMYEHHEIVDFFPLASLVNTNVSITATFDDRTFKTSILQKFRYFCMSNTSSWEGIKISDTSIKCPIIYADHMTNEFRIQSFIKVPSFAGEKEIRITVNESRLPFYYLQPAIISFGVDQLQFFYTETLVDLTVNVGQLIPSSLNQYLFLKFSDSSGFASQNNFSSNGIFTYGNSSTSTTTGGSKNLTLWYKHNDYQFQLSSNSLDIIFARISQITGIEPLVAIVNRTNSLTVNSAFPTALDYGSDVNFTCKYGPNETRYVFTSFATVDSNGRFFCSVQSNEVGLFFISLWMKAKSIDKKISSKDENLFFLTADFFTPSYGFATGNEKRTIFSYDRIESNVTFSNENLRNRYNFTCTKYAISQTLDCITPVLPSIDFPVYSSHPMIYTKIDKVLSMSWIVYERREISSFYPEVAPASSSDFEISIFLDQQMTIFEGSLYLVVAPKSNEDERYNLGKLNNTVNASTIISKLPGGTYPIELFYFNPNSFEFRSMFSISSQKNITFLTKSTIKFISGQNILYLDTKSNVTIKLLEKVNMLDFHRSKVTCRLGDTFLETYYNSTNPDEYVCSITSSVEKIDSIKLYYKDEKALNGSIDISKNDLDIIFVKVENVTSVAPFASIQSSQEVFINSTLNPIIYGSKVSYACSFNNSVFVGFIEGNYVKCTISTSSNVAFSEPVKLIIKSVETGIWLFLTNNRDENTLLYFLKPLNSKSIYPFLQTHKISGNGFLSDTITIEVESPLILIKEVYCRYVDTNGHQRLSKANYKEGNSSKIICSIDNYVFQQVVQDIQVNLWLNATLGSSFDITSFSQTYLFVREPLQWESLKVFNQNSTDSHVINYTRKGNFIYSVEMTPSIGTVNKSLLNCDFTKSKPSCNFTESNINSILYNPSILNITFFVKDSSLNIAAPVLVNPVTYYSNVDIQHLKPYVISFHEHQFHPARIISNVYTKLNSRDFSFKCKITSNNMSVTSETSFDLKSFEYQNGLDKESHFTCSFNTFGTSETFDIQLLFESAQGDIILTKKPAKINGVKTKPPFSPIVGSISGDFQIGPLFLYSHPTSGYSNYTLAFKLSTYVGYVDIPCSGSDLSGCTFPSLKNMYTDLIKPKKLKLFMFLDSVQAISFNPYVTLFPEIKVKQILPSKFISAKKSNEIGEPLKFIFDSEFKYFGEDIKSHYYLGTSEVPGKCTIESSKILTCSAPSFDEPGEARISFSTGPNSNVYYLNSTLTIFDDSIISALDTSNSILNFERNTSLTILGVNFLNSDIKLRFYDNYIDKIVDGKFVDDKTIKVTVTPFYDKHIVLPRKLALSISFDSGSSYISTTLSFTIPKFSDFSFKPNFIVKGNHSNGISLLGLENVKFSDTLSLRLLKKNSNEFLSLNCDRPVTKCNTSSIPTVTGDYDLKVGYIDEIGIWKDYFLISNDVMTVYEYIPPISFLPQIFICKDTKNPILIKGNFTGFKSVLFKYEMQQNVLFAVQTQDTLVYGDISQNELKSKVPPNNASSTAISISFNDGLSFHFITELPILSTYILDSVSPNTFEQNVFLIYEAREALLKGKGFVSNGKMKLKFQNPTAEHDITDVSEVKFVSSTDVTFTVPPISFFNFTYPLRFPFTFNLGLSFNDGFDFEFIPFVYVDAYPQADFIGINPIISSRREFNISLYVYNPQLVHLCSWYLPSNISIGNEIYETYPEYSNLTKSMSCHVPKFLSKYDEVVISVKNAQLELNVKTYTLMFYDSPTLLSIIPDRSPSFGGVATTITATNFLEPALNSAVTKIYCKYGDIACVENCKFGNNMTIICPVQSHPPGKANFSISYNQIDWHYLDAYSFTFETCDVGYTAESYKQPCKLCPPGTYKPTRGLYDCIKCEVGTYTEFAGASICEKCPTNTTSDIVGSSSNINCVCAPGYYVNPETQYYANGDRRCTTCPSGALCPGSNTTKPIAEYGYWYSKSDYHNFYKCNPESSCGGVGPENCTAGYTGIRCGNCQNRHYKFQKRCKNDKKRIKNQFRKLIKLHEKDEAMRSIIVGLHDLEEDDDLFNVKNVPWDVEYSYLPFEYKTDSASPEEEFNNINDIFENLFSWKRFNRKIYLIKRKGKRTTKVIQKMSHRKDEINIKKQETFQKTLKKVKKKTIFQNLDEKKLEKELDRYERDKIEIEEEKRQLELKRKKKPKKPMKPIKPLHSRKYEDTDNEITNKNKRSQNNFGTSFRISRRNDGSIIKSPIGSNAGTPTIQILSSPRYNYPMAQSEVSFNDDLLSSPKRRNLDDKLRNFMSDDDLETDDEFILSPKSPKSIDKSWSCHYDSTSGFPYYYNAITHESTWEKPQAIIDFESRSSLLSSPTSSNNGTPVLLERLVNKRRTETSPISKVTEENFSLALSKHLKRSSSKKNEEIQ